MDQLSELCRACLASSKCLESLDTECEQGYSLKFMLTSFCTLQMDDISVMYDNICKDCSSEILRAYNFKLQCEQNDVLLREKARALKYEGVCKKEGNYSSGVVEISLVKNEVEDVHVKEEDWMGGDDHRSSDDDETHNKIDNNNKQLNISTTSLEVPLTKVSRPSGSKEKSECQRKRKHVRLKEAQIVKNAFKSLGYKRVHECPKCGTIFGTYNLVHKHLDKVHNIILKRVEEYDEMERKARGIQKSRGQGEDKDFEKFDPKNPMFKCLECPHRCKDFEVMKKHIVVQHREYKYIHCSEDNCQYSTHEPRNLLNHIKLMHKNERNYSCDKCDYKTHSKFVLDSHHTTKHLNIKPFVCHLCAEAFVNKRTLQNHTAMKHEKELKFFCPTCTKGFYTEHHLRKHLKTHLGLKPHVCEHCGMAFTQKCNMEKHVFTLHTSTSEDSVLCSECPYKAKNIYSLQCHISRIHRSKTTVFCDYCGKNFSRKSALKIHIWKHMGLEPFKCSSCSCSYNCNSKLQAHIMMKHTGERPHQCQYCNYGSVTKRQLNVHMESHLNEQKYKCHLCPYSANRKATLVKHQKTSCGQLTRKYTPYKNKAAIDFTQLGHPIAEDGEPSDRV